METQFTLPPIKPTFFNGQKVVSTGQLAALLNCKRQTVTDIFRRHKKDFVEGVDFFFIEKDDLYDFKLQNGVFEGVEGVALTCRVFPNLPQPVPPLSKTANTAYLWTKNGVFKHATFFRTKRAKLILQSWLPVFFDGDLSPLLSPAPKNDFEPAKLNFEADKFNFEKAKLLIHAAEMTSDETLRDDLIKSAFEFLLRRNSD